MMPTIRTARDPRPVKEHHLQESLVQLLKLAAVPDLIWYAASNAGERSARTAAFLKRMGMLPGVADLSIVLPGGRACFLELKRPGKSVELREAQDAFRSLCARNGSSYAVAASYEEAEAILRGWGCLRETPWARSNPLSRAA